MFYGDKHDSPVITLPEGQLASLPAISLNLHLSPSGILDYEAEGKWRIAFQPLSLSLSAAPLIKGETFCALRSEEGEIGMSADKDGVKHFFVIGKPLLSPTFILAVQVTIIVTRSTITFP